MNYAALLAALVVLTFALPVLVRWAIGRGVHQATSIVAALIGGAMVLVWFFVRQKVLRDRAVNAKIERIRAKLSLEPNNPDAYVEDGEHLGDLLWDTRHENEAVTVFERYVALAKAAGQDASSTERKLMKLKSELNG